MYSETEKTKEIWENLAGWWDKEVVDGDLFHRTFIYPSILKFSDLKPTDRVLDIACGNGALSRLLAKSGAQIIGADFSEKLIRCAQDRSKNYHNLTFIQLDATDAIAIKKIAEKNKFNLVICSMAFQDMWSIEPLIATLKHILHFQGKFIFSIPHPCFNSGFVKFNLQPNHCPSITVSKYIKSEKSTINAKPNQPVPHFIYHRPLSLIFKLLMNGSMFMSEFEEPVAVDNALPNDFLWSLLKEIPPVVISTWIYNLKNV